MAKCLTLLYSLLKKIKIFSGETANFDRLECSPVNECPCIILAFKFLTSSFFQAFFLEFMTAIAGGLCSGQSSVSKTCELSKYFLLFYFSFVLWIL